MPKTILSISRDQILLETRAAILRKSGHRVLSVSSVEQLVETVEKNEIDLVVVGHTLGTTERESVYRAMKDYECDSPVIELYASAVPPKSSAQFQLAVHDRTFQIELLALVRQILSDTHN